MFNLKSKALSPTSFLHFKDGDDELMFGDDGQPIGAELFGPSSAEYAAIEKKIGDRNIRRMLKGKAKAEITAEQTRIEQVEKLVACTKAFTPNFAYGEGDLTGEDLARAVYSDRDVIFMFEQAKAHIEDTANFTKSSAKS